MTFFSLYIFFKLIILNDYNWKLAILNSLHMEESTLSYTVKGKRNFMCMNIMFVFFYTILLKKIFFNSFKHIPVCMIKIRESVDVLILSINSFKNHSIIRSKKPSPSWKNRQTDGNEYDWFYIYIYTFLFIYFPDCYFKRKVNLISDILFAIRFCLIFLAKIPYFYYFIFLLYNDWRWQ